MKILLLPLALLLAACDAQASDPTAGMTPPEKASFVAIQKFQRCMRPIVAHAKARTSITDREIELLGLACPEQLNDVAAKLAARADYRTEEPEFRNQTHEQKVAEIKKDFASHYWCEFRDCQVVD